MVLRRVKWHVVISDCRIVTSFMFNVVMVPVGAVCWTDVLNMSRSHYISYAWRTAVLKWTPAPRVGSWVTSICCRVFVSHECHVLPNRLIPSGLIPSDQSLKYSHFQSCPWYLGLADGRWPQSAYIYILSLDIPWHADFQTILAMTEKLYFIDLVNFLTISIPKTSINQKLKWRDLQLLLYTLRPTDLVRLFGSCSSSTNETELEVCVTERFHFSHRRMHNFF